MATIIRPTTKTVISTTQWGIPITDQVNQDTTDIATINGKITPTAWTNVTFQNGWSNFGSGYNGGQYRKIGDMVYCRGTIRGGAVGTVAFTLPAGFTPPATLGFPAAVFTTSRVIILITVGASGAVTINDATGNVDIGTIIFSTSA